MRKWTPEERARQSELIRAHKPWEKSTGPRTAAGKATASRNGTTHGLTSQAAKDFRAALHAARELLARARDMGLE